MAGRTRWTGRAVARGGMNMKDLCGLPALLRGVGVRDVDVLRPTSWPYRSINQHPTRRDAVRPRRVHGEINPLLKQTA